jgi:hypothetical protein
MNQGLHMESIHEKTRDQKSPSTVPLLYNFFKGWDALGANLTGNFQRCTILNVTVDTLVEGLLEIPNFTVICGYSGYNTGEYSNLVFWYGVSKGFA